MMKVATLEAQFTPARVKPVEERLALLLQIFEVIGKRLRSYNWTVGPGDWTCDGGTLALGFLADMLALEHKIQVGLYWHVRAETLAAIRGESVEEVRKQPMDEHHHWLEVKGPKGEWWRIDPNAEVRGESRLQKMGPQDAYEPRPDLEYWLGPQTDTRKEVAGDDKFLTTVGHALKRELGAIDLRTLEVASASEEDLGLG